MFRRHTRQRTSYIAVTIAFVLFALVIVRLPVELGRGRDFLVGLAQTGVLVVFFAVLWKINKFVALFLALAVVSRTVPTITLESQNALKCVLFGLGWYFFVYHYADERLLMDVMCVIAFAHFMATCVQFLKIPSVFSGTVSGLTFNPNEGAAMFALCFSAFLREGYKRYLAIIPIGIVMTGWGSQGGSFGGMIAVAIGATFYLCLSGHFWHVMPVFVFIVVFWWVVDTPNASRRWAVWNNAFKMYLAQWKWGCGLGHWETISKELIKAGIQLLPGCNAAYVRLHNSFLNGLIEMGIGFAVIVPAYIANSFRKFTRRALIPFTALIVVIVCCSTNSMFRMNAVNGIIAVTWLAILEMSLSRVNA